MNAIIWNIRSVNTQKVVTILINMHKRHKFYFVGPMVPFQIHHELEVYRRKLGFKIGFVNSNSKIWAFVD